MQGLQEIDFYEGIRQHIYESEEPFTVKFVTLSLTKNEGGEVKVLENQLQGPLRDNANKNLMIGLQNADRGDEVKHIYLHSIMEIINSKGHFKLTLNLSDYAK